MKSNTQQVTRDTIGSGPQIEMECPKCPSKKASCAQVQLRSADEGRTIFYTCLHCGHRVMSYTHCLLSKYRWLPFV